MGHIKDKVTKYVTKLSLRGVFSLDKTPFFTI